MPCLPLQPLQCPACHCSLGNALPATAASAMPCLPLQPRQVCCSVLIFDRGCSGAALSLTVTGVTNLRWLWHRRGCFWQAESVGDMRDVEADVAELRHTFMSEHEALEKRVRHRCYWLQAIHAVGHGPSMLYAMGHRCYWPRAVDPIGHGPSMLLAIGHPCCRL